MEWAFVVALVLAIPIILFPVAFVWYLNISGLYQVIKDTRIRKKRQAALAKELRAITEEKPATTGVAAREHTHEKELVGTKR